MHRGERGPDGPRRQTVNRTVRLENAIMTHRTIAGITALTIVLSAGSAGGWA